MPTKPTNTETPTGRGQVLRAATIVSVAFVISRILGFVRGAIILAIYSVDTLDVNAYEIASRFPDAIFYVIAGGALGSAFIPTFSTYFVRDDQKGGWRLFAAIINLVLVVLTIVCVLVAIFAEQFLLWLYAPIMSAQPGLLPLTASLMRVMLISTIIFGVSGVFMAALNARQHFVLPAIAPIIYNIGIILGTVLLAPNIMGVAIGTVVGAAGHLLIQVPGLVPKRAGYSLVFDLGDPGVRQVIRLMIPRMLGLSFGQINHFIIQILGQTLIFGSIPALSNAWRVMLVPQGAIGQALGIVSFPTFATLAAREDLPRMRRILAETLRFIFYLGIPTTILFIVFSRPIIAVLFQRGEFDAGDTELVASALAFYSVGLVGLSILEIVSRAFYALKDTWTPVLAGGVQLVFMAVLGYWLSVFVFPQIGLLPLGGLALGASVASSLEAVGLLILLRRKMDGINGWQIWDGLWRMSLAGLGMTLVTWFAFQQFTDLAPIWQVIGGGVVGGGVYLILSMLLRISESKQLFGYAQRWIFRR
jgi:putative peptidoglycan lipid II flippase